MKKPINEVSLEDVRDFKASFDDGFTNALDDYKVLAVRSAIYPGKGTPFGLMYAALGLAEAGEVQNKVKKIFRDDNILQFSETPETIGDVTFSAVMWTSVSAERKAQIIKELGGVLWYVAACCDELDIKLTDVAVANLEELASRAARGTLGGDGDNR